MDAHVLVPLLEPVVLLDVVQVVPADDAGAVHLELGDDARQDATADAHVAGERALLVDVVALASLDGRKNRRSSKMLPTGTLQTHNLVFTNIKLF